MKKNTFFTALSISIFIFAACEKKNETKISTNGSTESHNMGINCMSCHKQGEEGEGWFEVAGTVYDMEKTTPFSSGVIQLFTQPSGGGQLKYTIEVDGRGNFYTTENIDFGEGLYPAMKGNLSTQFMSTSVKSGQCNSCHGVSTERIWGE